MSDLIICQRITRPFENGHLKGPNNRLLTAVEVTALCSMYWPFAEFGRAQLIAQCESGWWTGAWNYVGEDSRGLFQLNVEAHPELQEWDLFDPQINAYWAYDLWKREGWHPWSCAHTLGIV